MTRAEYIDRIAVCTALAATATTTASYLRHIREENHWRMEAAPITSTEEADITARATARIKVYEEEDELKPHAD